MPASTADLVAGQRDFALDEQSNTTTRAVYRGARDTGAAPRAGYFDNAADAATVNAASFAFWGAPRRRLSVTMDGLVSALGGAPAVTPVVALTDASLLVAGDFVVTAVTFDLGSFSTSIEVIG